MPGRTCTVYWTDDLRVPFVPIATDVARFIQGASISSLMAQTESSLPTVRPCLRIARFAPRAVQTLVQTIAVSSCLFVEKPPTHLARTLLGRGRCTLPHRDVTESNHYVTDNQHQPKQ